MHYTLNTLFEQNVDEKHVMRQILINQVCDWLTALLPPVVKNAKCRLTHVKRRR